MEKQVLSVHQLPGFVVYYTNYSLIIDSDIGDLKEISD